ncbi:MAG: type IV pilus twitching motility protein PilT [Deltaproteobacteria bacterium]|nr:type IV pilus twitching motility protein PilT [Deltaproteobacteria bacterium]
MARLDTFIAQLVQREGEALMIEGGNNIFLLKGGQLEPLVDARKGTLQNEHVMALLKDIAPPEAQKNLDANVPATFTYESPNGPAVVKTAIRDGRLMARLKLGASSLSSGEGPAASSSSSSPSSRRGSGSNEEGGLSVSPRVLSPDPVTSPPPTAFPPTPMPEVRAAASPSSSPPQPARLAPGEKPRAEVWFNVFLKSKASDLHLTSTKPAMMRVDGDMKLEPLIPTLDAEILEEHLLEIMPARNRREFEESNDTDFAYEMPNARLRCNIFRDRRGACAVFRRIPAKIQSAQELGLPQVIVELGRLKKGLVLVTGPTGSGKSTTLAALVDWVNANRSDHIITIEDPIEFVHEPKKCLVHQRQVGEHTTSFAKALRAALREDPDIVLVGEMRDLETVAIAIETAETGHLVFGTLHTTTAASTVDRIIDQFAADRQEQIRTMLSESLKGVISQTLCKKKGGGRVAALEILISSTAVSNMIREKKTHQIPSLMQTQRGSGMRTLNDALLELVRSGVVAPEEAFDKSMDRGSILKDLKSQGFMLTSPEEK